MSTVRPHGTFKNGFDLVDDTGRKLGSFAGSAWRERGEISAGGEVARFTRQGGRRFTLDGPAGESAAADKPSAWSGRWVLQAGGRAYELARRSWWSQAYELSSAGQVVGSVQPKGLFSGKAAVDLPAELPPIVQVFAVAVVMTLGRRESAAVAAGGAAAAGSS
jgi:hypothetical protein